MTTTIQQYWNARAQDHPKSPSATTNDIHLRELEFRTLKHHIARLSLPTGAWVLDAGCGDGATTIRLAEAFPSLRFVGIDYAESMIETARQHLNQPRFEKRVRFDVGDVTRLEAYSFDHAFDLAITCRCLINLADLSTQRLALEQIAACLAPQATFLAIENFHDGQEHMNAARHAIGLPAIPIRWHNCYFHEREFAEMARTRFAHVEFVDFASAYYYATRVIYSKVCQMRSEEPDYDHEIHRLAVDLAPHGSFSPVRLAILRR